MSASSPTSVAAAWECLDASAQLWVSKYYVPGFQCRTVAAPLQNGGWLFLSPGGSLAGPLPEAMAAQGAPELLLLPNGYHHMGIDAWIQAFPSVKVCGAEAARKRAMGQHPGVEIRDLTLVKQRLASHVKLLEMPGNRIGEVWLAFQSEQGISWAIGDAFFNIPKMPKNPVQRLIFRLLGSAPGLRMSQLFKWGAIQQRAAVRQWLEAQLDTDHPVRMVPNHGEVLEDKTLGQGQVQSRLRALIEARL